jgi:hypothetical protein
MIYEWMDGLGNSRRGVWAVSWRNELRHFRDGKWNEDIIYCVMFHDLLLGFCCVARGLSVGQSSDEIK